MRTPSAATNSLPQSANGGGGDGGKGSGDGGNAVMSTGGGGGGCNSVNANYGYDAGAGASGIVILRYQIASIDSLKASGGNVSFVGSKTVHTFTSSGTFTANEALTVDYLLVGGGGGASGNNGSGAGGGGVVAATGAPLPSGPHSITVGSGGAGGKSVVTTMLEHSGEDSTFNSLTAGRRKGSHYPNVVVVPVEHLLDHLVEHQLLLVVQVVVVATLVVLHLDLVDLHLVLIQTQLDMLVVLDLHNGGNGPGTLGGGGGAGQVGGDGGSSGGSGGNGYQNNILGTNYYWGGGGGGSASNHPEAGRGGKGGGGGGAGGNQTGGPGQAPAGPELYAGGAGVDSQNGAAGNGG